LLDAAYPLFCSLYFCWVSSLIPYTQFNIWNWYEAFTKIIYIINQFIKLKNQFWYEYFWQVWVITLGAAFSLYNFFSSFFYIFNSFLNKLFLSILYMCIIPIEHSFSLSFPPVHTKKRARWLYRALKFFFSMEIKLSLRAVHSIKFMILNLICKLRIDRRGVEECWLNEKLINAIIVMWHKLFLPIQQHRNLFFANHSSKINKVWMKWMRK